MNIKDQRCDPPSLQSRDHLAGRLLAVLFASVFCQAAVGQAPAPLIYAYAHNDYVHERPLLDALDHGFCSVEADVHLVEGALLVAHEEGQVQPERTLQSLYLDPLSDRVRLNGGRVYENGPEFLLMIDVKTDAEETYSVLRQVLEQYATREGNEGFLTVFRQGRLEQGAITVVVSGNRPIKTMASEWVRYASVDGRIQDLDSLRPATLMPIISERFRLVFKWTGVGPMPDGEKQKLKEIVEAAHAKGRRVRFWATPERVEVWHELLAASVDLICTDNLDGLHEYLTHQAP